MIEKDAIMRQVQQLAQALAAILLNQQQHRPDLAESHLIQALRDVFRRDLDQLRLMSKDELVELCSPGGTWSADLALALADLLREDDGPEIRERAGWLYEAALEAGDLVPMDIFERMEALREK